MEEEFKKLSKEGHKYINLLYLLAVISIIVSILAVSDTIWFHWLRSRLYILLIYVMVMFILQYQLNKKVAYMLQCMDKLRRDIREQIRDSNYE